MGLGGEHGAGSSTSTARPVRDFLAWVGRELGREIVFATAESEAEARRAVLSGSITGLTPA